MQNQPPMLNLDDLELRPFGNGEKFAATLGRIGGPLGMKKIGCGLVVLEPGKRAWPHHEHYGQEELFIILDGEGSIRYGEETFPVKSGDVIFTPPGKGTAHQIVNTSDAEIALSRVQLHRQSGGLLLPGLGKIWRLLVQRRVRRALHGARRCGCRLLGRRGLKKAPALCWGRRLV